MRALFYVRTFFFIFGKHFSEEKNNGDGKGGKYSESEKKHKKEEKKRFEEGKKMFDFRGKE